MAEEQVTQETPEQQIARVIRQNLPFMKTVYSRIARALEKGADEDTLGLINIPISASLFGALTVLAASMYEEKQPDEPQ